MGLNDQATLNAGVQLLNNGVNALAQGKMNKATRKFAEKQALQQRGWAIEDRDQQNAYNSPEAQMARYKAAKLNPNLIYGQSNEGATVRSSPAADWNPRAPELNLDAAPVMSAYWDAKQKPLQNDLLAQQSKILELEALLKSAQTNNVNADTASKLVNTDTSKFNLEMLNTLKPISLQAAELGVKKQQADIQYTLNNDERQAAQTSSNLREAISRISNMAVQNSKLYAEKEKIQQETKNLLTSNELQALELKLRSSGLTPNSSDFLKILETQLDLIPSLKNGYEKIKNFRNDYWKSVKKLTFGK